MKPTIEFTAEKIRALRTAYEAAKAAGQETFIFEGHEFLVRYVHYMLEYLESKA
jgi:hypothetical protein